MQSINRKEALRKEIIGFLKQRRHWYKSNNNIRLTDSANHVLGRFQVIQNWDYWRHCLEVKNAEPIILQLLPSANGRHVTKRNRILQLIEKCKEVAIIPARIYRTTIS